MISLAERPLPLEVMDAVSQYGPDKLDDKPYLHKRQGLYYLSWGCYYAVSENLYGPYRCMGSFLLEPEGPSPFTCTHCPYDKDRHGSFFQFGGRWYFIGNDSSHTRNRFFRDSIILEIGYAEDGTIIPVAPRQVVG